MTDPRRIPNTEVKAAAGASPAVDAGVLAELSVEELLLSGGLRRLSVVQMFEEVTA